MSGSLQFKTAPSFNGRTADSGSAYRGSNPWGAAKFWALSADFPRDHLPEYLFSPKDKKSPVSVVENPPFRKLRERIAPGETTSPHCQCPLCFSHEIF